MLTSQAPDLKKSGELLSSPDGSGRRLSGRFFIGKTSFPAITENQEHFLHLLPPSSSKSVSATHWPIHNSVLPARLVRPLWEQP